VTAALADCAVDVTHLRSRRHHLTARPPDRDLGEYGMVRVVCDLRVHQILEGTNEIMRVIVARGLTEAFG
jgi:hypothetical protein